MGCKGSSSRIVNACVCVCVHLLEVKIVVETAFAMSYYEVGQTNDLSNLRRLYKVLFKEQNGSFFSTQAACVHYNSICYT